MTLGTQITVLLIVSLLLSAITYVIVGKIDISKENEITLDVALAKTNVLWVDARGVDAYEKEHVPKALLLNEDDWEQLIIAFLDAWNPDITVVVYCTSAACNASQAVALRLTTDYEIENVYVLKDGWDAWKNKKKSK